MTIAHPDADHCSLCFITGKLVPAHPTWPGAPCCRKCIIACGGTIEETASSLTSMFEAIEQVFTPTPIPEKPRPRLRLVTVNGETIH